MSAVKTDLAVWAERFHFLAEIVLEIAMLFLGKKHSLHVV